MKMINAMISFRFASLTLNNDKKKSKRVQLKKIHRKIINNSTNHIGNKECQNQKNFVCSVYLIFDLLTMFGNDVWFPVDGVE
jgi:CRISPR/Cas system CSM-associated protein Csm4 (group 5 of RAMP superfamily)